MYDQYPYTREEIIEKFRQEKVTDVEFLCLYMRTLGLSDKQIAKEIHYEPSTVHTYRRRAREKIGLSGIEDPLQTALLMRNVYEAMKHMAENREEYYTQPEYENIVIFSPRTNTTINLWRPGDLDPMDTVYAARFIKTLIHILITVIVLTFVVIIILILVSTYMD
jgi:DNA-binding CsgD family transcriptional regulator